MLEEMGANPDDARSVIEDFGWAVEQPVTELERWINENGGGDTEDLEARVAALEVEVTGVEDQIVTLQGSITSVQTMFGTLEADLTAFGGRVTAVEGSVVTIETDVGTIEVDLAAAMGDITNLDTNLEQQGVQLVTVEGNVVTIEGNITNLQSTVTTLQGVVQSVQGNVTTIETNIGALQVDLTAIGGRVTSVEGNIVTIETNVGTVQVDLTQAMGDITNLDTDLDTQGVQLVTLSGNVVTVMGSVTTLTGRVDTIDVDLADILNNLIPNTIRVGTVESIGATSITVRVAVNEVVEAVEWFVPVTPILGERIIVGRSGDDWVIVSTFEVESPIVVFTTTSFTVREPTNPAVEKWQIRYRRQGEGWTEGDEITPTTGDDDETVSGLTAGAFDVEVRYDLVGPTGFGRWSGSTVLVIPANLPAAPTVIGGVGEFTVNRPVEANIDMWQYRWRIQGGGWFESDGIAGTEPNATEEVDAGSYEVAVRYDPTGAVGYSDWSETTPTTVTTSLPVPNPARDINFGPNLGTATAWGGLSDEITLWVVWQFATPNPGSAGLRATTCPREPSTRQDASP